MLFALLFVACSVEGPVGPAGPEGPRGQDGAPGSVGPAGPTVGLAWHDAEGVRVVDWPDPIVVGPDGYVWRLDPEEARLLPVADLEARPLLFEAPSCEGAAWTAGLPLPREVVEILGGWRARGDAQATERVCPRSAREDGACVPYVGPACAWLLNADEFAIVPTPGPTRWAAPLHLRAR